MARHRGTSKVPSAKNEKSQRRPPTTGFTSPGIKSRIVRREITIERRDAAKATSKYRIVVLNQKGTVLV